MYLVLYYSHTNINRIGDKPDIGGPWFTGSLINFEVQQPLHFSISPDSVGTDMRAIYTGAYPLYRNDVIDALVEAGVNNLQLFDAVIKNPFDGKIYDNYKAVNILGLISCADMEESTLMDETDSETIDVDFDELIIDEEKAGEALYFRLGENVTAVIAHEKVADIVESKNIPGVKFLLPENWSG